jgi:hypothetical protein
MPTHDCIDYHVTCIMKITEKAQKDFDLCPTCLLVSVAMSCLVTIHANHGMSSSGIRNLVGVVMDDAETDRGPIQ